MTTKDYIVLASQFKEALQLAEAMEHSVKLSPSEYLRATIKDMATALKADNPRFNVEKWNVYIFGDK